MKFYFIDWFHSSRNKRILSSSFSFSSCHHLVGIFRTCIFGKSLFLWLERVDLSFNFFAGLSSTRAFVFRLLHLPHVHPDRAIHQVCSLIGLDQACFFNVFPPPCVLQIAEKLSLAKNSLSLAKTLEFSNKKTP